VFVVKVHVILGLLALSLAGNAAPIVSSTVKVSLNTGSLAGINFPLSFSYDAGQIQPTGDSYLFLQSFDFVLLGVPFNLREVFQGGQIIFSDGHFDLFNVSYQVFLPQNSPVKNITFYSGVAYIDLKGNYGTGTFGRPQVIVARRRFSSSPKPSALGIIETPVPEPSASSMVGMSLLSLAMVWHFRVRGRRSLKNTIRAGAAVQPDDVGDLQTIAAG
jgi:hypothetical protein